MKTFVLAAVAALFSISAHAAPLVIPTGHVISDDCAEGNTCSGDSTPTGQAAIENDGYLVSSGVIFLPGGASVTVADFLASSTDERRELIGDAYANIEGDVLSEVSDEVAEALEHGVSQEFIDQALNYINENGGVIPTECPFADCSGAGTYK